MQQGLYAKDGLQVGLPVSGLISAGPIEPMRRLVEGPFMNSMTQEGVTPSGAPAISHSGYFLLVDRNALGRQTADALKDLLHHSPRTLGKPTSLWTLDLLAEVLRSPAFPATSAFRSPARRSRAR